MGPSLLFEIRAWLCRELDGLVKQQGDGEEQRRKSKHGNELISKRTKHLPC